MGDVTMRILLICGIISLILGATINPNPEIRWIDGFAIIVAVFIVVVVTAINDLQKNKKFSQLKNVKKESLEVQILVDGKNTFKKPDELIVGDVMVIQGGTNIAADGILFASSELMCDEVDLT